MQPDMYASCMQAARQRQAEKAYRDQLCGCQIPVLVGIKQGEDDVQGRIAQLPLHHLLHCPL